MDVSSSISPRSLLAACAAVGAFLLVSILPGDAHAAGVVGPSGQISSCYVKKGKAKGTLRVVPSGKRCRKGEKHLTLNAQGPQGQQGASGTQGSSGQLDSLTTQLSELQSRVTQLEGVLSGLTNSDLLTALTGVNALCTQVSSTVTQLNSIRSVLTGLNLSGGLLGLGLGGLVLGNPIPSALSPFTCP